MPDREGPAEIRKPLQPLSAATETIKKVIAPIDSEDGWVHLGQVGKQLANLAPDFDSRTYGFSKLSDLVRKTNAFEIAPSEAGVLRIRLKKGPSENRRARHGTPERS